MDCIRPVSSGGETITCLGSASLAEGSARTRALPFSAFAREVLPSLIGFGGIPLRYFVKPERCVARGTWPTSMLRRLAAASMLRLADQKRLTRSRSLTNASRKIGPRMSFFYTKEASAEKDSHRAHNGMRTWSVVLTSMA